MVGDYINTMKTTFDFNFVLYQAFKQHGYTNRMKKERNCQLQGFSLIKRKLVIRKNLDNKNLNKKVVFNILILSPTTVVVCTVCTTYFETLDYINLI